MIPVLWNTILPRRETQTLSIRKNDELSRLKGTILNFFISFPEEVFNFLSLQLQSKLDMEKIKYAFFFIFIGKAALISAMMFAPSTAAQMQTLDHDTFERSPKMEYVTEPNDRFADDVFVVNAEPVGNKERGEFFNRWFWAMVVCVDDDGKFQDSKLGTAPKYIKVPNKDYRQLAADIICTFDKNGDNKVNYDEYIEKSKALLNQKAGKTLPPNVIDNFSREFFYPLFYGFDYDNNTKEYNIDEVAATIYALDGYSSSGKGILSGERLMNEVNYVLENGNPDECFDRSRINYYKEYVK